MEVRVKNIIINVDVPQMTEHDKAFVEQQANLIVGYFKSNQRLRQIVHIMMADAGVTLAKLALLQSMDNEHREETKDGGV